MRRHFLKILLCIVLSVCLPLAKADNLTLSDWRYIYKNIESISTSSNNIPVNLSAELISQLLDSLDRHLQGKQIPFACTADNSKTEPVTSSARVDEPEDILDRLAGRSFQDLFIHVEAEALSRVLLNKTATPEEKESACDRIDYYHKLSVCLTTGGTCPARPGMGNNNIIVIQETARLRQRLVEYLPFILFAYRTDTAYWHEAANSSDLKPAFSRLLQSAIQFYLEWHRAQIVFASVDSLPEFVIEELVRHGAPVEQIRTLRNQLGKSNIDLEQISRETLESVGIRQQVEELETNLQAMVAHARATERALVEYKKEIDARIDWMSEVLADAQKNGLKSIGGRLLSEAEVAANEVVRRSVERGTESLGSQMPAFIPLDPSGALRLRLSNSQSIDPVSAEVEFKGELVVVRSAPAVSEMTLTTADGEVEPISVEETISLGITMERLKITARDPYAWQLPESQLRPFVRVNQPVLIAGLRRLGLPEAISFSSVSVTPDKELKNINLHINVTPPFTDSPSTLILPLMSNGKFNVDASAIEAFVRTTITKVYQPAINTWMQRFSGSIVLPGTPFEFSADNTNVEYLFDQRYLRVTTTFTLLDTRDGTRTSWDVATTVNGHGVIPPVFNLPDAAEKKLIAYLEREIRDALPDDVDRFLSHVNFSVDKGKPAATVYWDLRFAGCEINNSTTIDFSANWLRQGEEVVRTAAARLGDCATEIALKRTQEQLDQFLMNRELNLFGLLRATVAQVETVGSKRRMTLAVEAGDAVPPFTVEGVMLDASPAGVAMSFRDAKVTEGRAELEQLGETLFKKYLPLPPESLSFRRTRLSPRGITTVVTFKDAPFLGTVELGTLEISAYGVSFDDNRHQLRILIKNLMTDKVNALLAKNAVEIPGFGPITITGQPNVFFESDQLQVLLHGTASLYAGLALQVYVPVFPKLDLDRIRVETNGVEEALKAALGDAGLNFGPLRIANVSPIKRPLSVQFDAQVDFGFMKGKLTKATLHRDGLDLPETITARTAGVIPLGQAVSIKDPGLTYYLRNQGKLTLLGDLIIGPGEATAELVYFDSRLTLSARPLSFAFTGDLVAANSLRLMEVKGEADFTEGVLTFEAKTNQILEKLIDVSATGKADFRAATIESVAHNRMLGIDMPSGSLFIDVSEGTVRINGAADIPISKLDIGVQSDLLLRDPSAATSFDFKVGSYRMANADIKINPALADLRFNVLGFNFTVLAPSVGAITPDIVLRTILSVLDFDIESLLKSLENKDITISMFNGDGSRAQAGSSSDSAGRGEPVPTPPGGGDPPPPKFQVGNGNPSDFGTGGDRSAELICQRFGETFSILGRDLKQGFIQTIATNLPVAFYGELCAGEKFLSNTWSIVDAPFTPKQCDPRSGEPVKGWFRYYQRELDCGLLTRGAVNRNGIKPVDIPVSKRTWKILRDALENGVIDQDAGRAAHSIYNEALQEIRSENPDGVFMPFFHIDRADLHEVFQEKSSGSIFGLFGDPEVTVNVRFDVELGGWWRVATFLYHRQNRNIHMFSHCRASPLGLASERYRMLDNTYGRGFSFYTPYGDSPANTLDRWDEVPDTLRECESSHGVLRPFSDLRKQEEVTRFWEKSNILAPLQQDILWLELHARHKLDNPNAVGPEPRRLGSYSLPEGNGVPLNVEEVLYEPSGEPKELHLLVVNPDSGDGKSRQYYENTPVFKLLNDNSGGELNQFVAREIYRDYHLKSELEVNGRHLFGSYPAGYAGEPERLYCVGANRVSGPVTLVDATKYGNWRTTHVPPAVGAFCEGQWKTARLGRDTVQSLPVVLLADSDSQKVIDKLKLIIANPLSPDQPFVEVREMESVVERFAERSNIAQDKIIDSLLHPNDYYPDKTRVHPFTLFRSAQ